MDKLIPALAAARELLDTLTGPGGCPWDAEQTPESLCDYLIEECHELIEAIHTQRAADVQEELGDVIFLLLFLAKRYEDRNAFTLADALAVNTAKMQRRHPHVFAGASFSSRNEQLAAWETIKRAEKKQAAAGQPTGTFSSLPKGLPPLIKAYRLHAKAARAGFTWESDEDVEQQVENEWIEWIDAAQAGSSAQLESELGDLLFSLVELGRRKGIKANAALAKANAKFLRRFEAMETIARQRDLDFATLEFPEQDALWGEVKAAEKDYDALQDE